MARRVAGLSTTQACHDVVVELEHRHPIFYRSNIACAPAIKTCIWSGSFLVRFGPSSKSHSTAETK